MISIVVTKDYNSYGVSNDALDDGYRFKALDNALIIFLKDAWHPSFRSKEAIIAIPYFMISNIIYFDEFGKALSDYNLYKNDKGKPCDAPETPPYLPENYDVEKRYISLYGEHVFAESNLI
jgi:hypothetical protein